MSIKIKNRFFYRARGPYITAPYYPKHKTKKSYSRVKKMRNVNSLEEELVCFALQYIFLCILPKEQII